MAPDACFAGPGHDDPAVRFEGDVHGVARRDSRIGGDTADPVGRVLTPVRVVPCHDNVLAGAGIDGHIHASVDVHGERRGEVPGDLAARAEGGIQAAVGVVADHGEVPAGRPRQDDLAVRLEAHGPGEVPAVVVDI